MKNRTFAQWTPINSGNYYSSSANFGLATTASVAPTHSLTLGSTSTGIAVYNTVDQATNFEHAILNWNSDSFLIANQQGGTGTQRPILLNGNVVRLQHAGATKAQLSGSVVGQFLITVPISGTANSSGLGISGSYTNSANTANAIAVLPTINQTSTAGYRGLWVSPYIATSGSGSKFLVDMGTNSLANGSGDHTTKFAIDPFGATVLARALKIGSATSSQNAMLEITAPAGYTTNSTFSTSGSGIQVDPATYTSNAAAGPVTDQGTNTIGIPTLTATNNTYITNASNVYVAGAPVAGSNVTNTYPYALYIASGNNYFAGNVGIGTTTPREALSVNGIVRAREVKIEGINWPDHVFSTVYELPALNTVKAYIGSNHHLPDIPSEHEVAKNGVAQGDMKTLLLKKIEELTLYLIEGSKQFEEQKKIAEDLKGQIDKLTKKHYAIHHTRK